MVVPEALPVAGPCSVLLDQLFEQLRFRAEVAGVVPLGGRQQHRNFNAGEVAGHHHLRPACLVFAEVRELAFRRASEKSKV